MSESSSESRGWVPRAGAWLAWASWAVLAFNALSRVVTTLDPFPAFELDPTIVFTPASGLGPSGAMALDAAALLAAAGAVLADRLRSRRVSPVLAAMLAAGGVPVFAHAFAGGVPSLDDARIGVSWLAAMATGFALLHLARDEAVRRLSLALALGVIAILAARGVVQVFVEHPATVREFERSREAILGAHGWSEDSPLARGFERRLRQPEATGWFGLANVYASVAASSGVALLGLAVLSWRAARSPRRDVPGGIAAVVTLGWIAALGAVALAGSKAGYAMTALGAVLLVIAWLSARTGARATRLASTSGGLLALAVMAAVVIAVTVRGMIGERLGESSILFRWFYIRGASRVFIGHWLWGTGPAGFKDAYMLAKPAIAPESVESPHSLAFDLAARLGVLGFAWVGLAFTLIWRCGVALRNTGATPAPTARPAPTRPEAWAVAGLAAGSVVFSAWLESATTTPESAAARLIGLVGWIGLSLSIAWASRGLSARPCFAAAAIVLAAHAQLEMTPVQPGSAAWFMFVVGAAAACPTSSEGRRSGPGWAWAPASILPVAAAAGIGWFAWPPIIAWERDLARAASALRPLAEFRERLGALPESEPAGADSLGAIAAALGRALTRPPPTNEAELDGAMTRLALDSIDRALPLVRRAADRVRHERTLAALSRLHLARASVCAASGDDAGAKAHGDLAEHVAREGVARFPGSASAHGWLGTVLAARAGFEHDPAHLASAAEAWENAARLDPHGMTFPLQVLHALAALGRTDEARTWARRVLDADERLRLDPMLRLSEHQRAAVERAAGVRPP